MFTTLEIAVVLLLVISSIGAVRTGRRNVVFVAAVAVGAAITVLYWIEMTAGPDEYPVWTLANQEAR